MSKKRKIIWIIASGAESQAKAIFERIGLHLLFIFYYSLIKMIVRQLVVTKKIIWVVIRRCTVLVYSEQMNAEHVVARKSF